MNHLKGRLDKRYKRAGKTWSPEELDYLSSKYGLISDRSICQHLQRSPNALKIAATRKLHSNRKMNFYTANELAKVLGIPCSKTLIPWVEVGWLKARRSVVRAGNYWAWRFLDSNIEKFLRNKPWLFNLQKMPEHYFRSIIREEYNKDPWYTCKEAAPLLGVKTDDAVQRYIFRGWLPALKRPGGPWQGVWIIRRSAIQQFLATDPRPSRSESMSFNINERRLKDGLPMRLSIHWSVLCQRCGQRVLVKAHPGLKGPVVQKLFAEIYANGTCSHGLICTLEYKEVVRCQKKG